jgi:hypothetical protein
MATTIADVSNDTAKDGLLKDVYLDEKMKKKAKEARKRAETMKVRHFGPHHDG